MAIALLAGASGLVGGSLLAQLLASSAYDEVVALVRRPLAVAHPKLRQVVVDYAHLDLATAIGRADDAFCCLGTTLKRAGSQAAFRSVDHDAVLAFARAAQRAGARRFFVVSSLGAAVDSRVFYNRVKGEMEAALRGRDFATLGIFRPSLLLGGRAEARWGERVGSLALTLLAPVLVGRWRRYRAIPAEVVARAMLRCAAGTGARGVLTLGSEELQVLGRPEAGRPDAAV